jgi:tetratricopeptide (TPR) repeat protein
LHVATLFLVAAGEPAAPKPVAQTELRDPVFEDLSKRAGAAREAGRLDEAAGLYSDALRRAPRWAEGWWYLGTIRYDADRYPDARDAFRNLTGLQPEKAASWAFAGLCEYQTREYDLALRDLKKALALGIDDEPELGAAARYHAAVLMLRSEQYEVAFQTLNRLARQHNESPNVVVACGLSILRMPILPADIPPQDRDLVLLAGRAAYGWAARRPEARGAFGELVARYPRTPNVHYSFGVFLLDVDADAALEEFGKELELSPSHVPALLQISLERAKRGEYAAGLPFATKAVALAPGNFVARNALGRILIETGDASGAIEQLEAGVKLAPDSPEMHFALARAYARGERPDDAARERQTFKMLEEARTRAAQAAAGGDATPPAEPPR